MDKHRSGLEGLDTDATVPALHRSGYRLTQINGCALRISAVIGAYSAIPAAFDGGQSAEGMLSFRWNLDVELTLPCDSAQSDSCDGLVYWEANIVKPSEALRAHRDLIRRTVEAHRVCNARVFGSAAYGNDTDDSDLDLLVDTLPGATLFDLGGLQIELEEALGVSIDLLTPGDLPSKFRDRVLAAAVPI